MDSGHQTANHQFFLSNFLGRTALSPVVLVVILMEISQQVQNKISSKKCLEREKKGNINIQLKKANSNIYKIEISVKQTKEK